MRKTESCFDRSLKTKRGFLLCLIVVVGIGAALVLNWNLGQQGNIFLSLILTSVGLATGLLWGFLMWAFFVKHKLSPDKR